ncbi:MAG: DUF4058 family protein [Armatimonadetes bacterium]|nr:DUF4058 family protein [Armatimonadota bacterium]MCX7969132.1 DUF4058 family protein [Armatimonadota bacterium]MDW8144125.1 DUF4058 family protein [Armatimonadota bacterium]
MPSPFPGMDPYLETPEIWVDFHNNLASEIQANLNRTMPKRYIARLSPRIVCEIVETGELKAFRPDVAVYHQTEEQGMVQTATTVLTAPVESRVAIEEFVKLHSVEILEVGTMRLVTAIEILSPANKRLGNKAREEYLDKRREILRSSVHLIEIDLIRAGERMPLETPVPKAAYYIVLSRYQRRPIVEVWPIQIWEKLPTIPVPLLPPDPDVPLDLNAVVASVYERGAYDRIIDYRQPPPPPLTDEEAKWIDDWLREKKLR